MNVSILAEITERQRLSTANDKRSLHHLDFSIFEKDSNRIFFFESYENSWNVSPVCLMLLMISPIAATKSANLDSPNSNDLSCRKKEIGMDLNPMSVVTVIDSLVRFTTSQIDDYRRQMEFSRCFHCEISVIANYHQRESYVSLTLKNSDRVSSEYCSRI